MNHEEPNAERSNSDDENEKTYDSWDDDDGSLADYYAAQALKRVVHEACAEERLDDVEKLLIEGRNVNQYCGKFKGTPLHVACTTGNLELIKILVKHGALVRSVNDYWDTPLHIVLKNFRDTKRPLVECIDIVRLLIESGAALNTTNARVSTPLHIACENYYVDIAALLLSAGADANAQPNEDDEDEIMHDERFGTPLHVVCSLYFISKVPDIHVSDTASLAKLLISHGADVNRQNTSGETPLQLACSGNISESNGAKHLELIEFLLDNGADINAGAFDTESPLRIACEYNSPKCVEVLLNHWAEVSGNELCNLLEIACAAGQIEVIKVLIQHGADVYQMDLNNFAEEAAKGFLGLWDQVPVKVFRLLLRHSLNYNFETLLKTVLSAEYDVVGDNTYIKKEMHSCILEHYTPSPRVPSLMELCRDKVRESLAKTCHNTASLMTAVDSLTVPEDLKNIILTHYPVNITH